jgi:hypothetical protein
VQCNKGHLNTKKPITSFIPQAGEALEGILELSNVSCILLGPSTRKALEAKPFSYMLISHDNQGWHGR